MYTAFFKRYFVLLVAFNFLAETTTALRAYGHAYGVRPHDFTSAQYAAIASRFEVFTVEKDHATDVYGNSTAPHTSPHRTNSIAASVGTARKIKALNASVKVLMYWNSALHYNFYECESEVQPSWIMPGPNPAKSVPFYNYSVPAFRAWWVRCAVDAVQNSNGALDGLFLDATPKVDVTDQLDAWGAMVDQLRAALGANAILIDNGFFLQPSGKKLAGDAAWEHTSSSYTESMSSVGGESNAEKGVQYLLWVAQSAQKFPYPNRTLIGHGGISSNATTDVGDNAVLDPTFRFGLAKYLLTTSTVANGWFLANHGYCIDEGLLSQPMSVYSGVGVGCGEPISMVERVGGPNSFRLQRMFEHGSIVVDVDTQNASIIC
eukprot:m.16419 g.16419  ORF g.16419 m.16419 type:complete len:376 (+) comp11033_c0_seq1:83-1210(+)